MNGRLVASIKWGLTVLFVMILGYSMVHGTGGMNLRPIPIEGMGGDTSRCNSLTENTLEILKNTASIDLLTGKVDDLKDVKKDLTEIREKLNGNSDRLTTLTQQMIEGKKSGTESITALV